MTTEVTATSITQIIGLTPVNVVQKDEEIIMIFRCGSFARWYHEQDCCETVEVEEVAGDWTNLYEHPLIVAETRTAQGANGQWGDSATWTFYTFRNVGGTVDVRWLGVSNGYYSEAVYFQFVAARSPFREDGT